MLTFKQATFINKKKEAQCFQLWILSSILQCFHSNEHFTLPLLQPDCKNNASTSGCPVWHGGTSLAILPHGGEASAKSNLLFARSWMTIKCKLSVQIYDHQTKSSDKRSPCFKCMDGTKPLVCSGPYLVNMKAKK